MCPVGVTRGKQARREAPTDGLASGCHSGKLVVADAVARFWQSVVDTQARRAAELSGDHGVFRQRLRWIEPAELLGNAPHSGALPAARQPEARCRGRNRLAACGQGPGGPQTIRTSGWPWALRSKERSVPSAESSNRVLLQGAGDAYTPIIGWRHYGDHRPAHYAVPVLAPMRRSSSGSFFHTAIRDNCALAASLSKRPK